MRAERRSASRLQRGLSLVELMVGITVGLFVVAAAATLVASQLADNRKLLTETQIQQDLRASMDIIARQLRRSAALDIALTQSGLGTSGGSGGSKNAYGGITPGSGSNLNSVQFSFYRNASEQGPYGFKLDSGVIKSLVGAGGWTDLTDSNTMTVTNFSVTSNHTASGVLPCPKPCADGTSACWPTLLQRNYTVTIAAQAKNDSTVQRSITSEVRLRNDVVQFNDSANPTLVCPP
jgi:type IV pilus assembly protein PilW